MNEGNKKIREEITNNLIEAIKNGTAPWQKPWEGRGAPQNAISGRQYNGINQLILTYQGLNFDDGKDPRWLTFKQANDNGWKIKKGAKGTHVVLWKPLSAINEETEETEIVAIMQKFFTVFHASQIEGINEYEHKPLNEIEAHEKTEKIIQNSGAKIIYGGGRAFYNANDDVIQLPQKGDFKSSIGYYSTILHELTHWTGHSSRLNRKFGYNKYSDSYAFEELIAEIGSMFLASSSGIPQAEGEFQNHASYVDSWLNSLKKDNNAIFKAAAEASKAADFLLKGIDPCNKSSQQTQQKITFKETAIAQKRRSIKKEQEERQLLLF